MVSHATDTKKIKKYVLLKFIASSKVKIWLFPFQPALKILFILEKSLDLTPLL